MTTLTSDQIAAYAKQAGFTGEDIKIAVAVALAESGGNPRSHNATPPDDSYGLWQINMLGDLGPSRRKDFGIKTNEELYDPAVNARAAYIVWKRSGWGAWTTYTHGKYKAFLSGLSASGGVAGAIGSVLGNGQDIADGTVKLDPVSKVAAAIDGFGKNVFNGIASLVAMGVASALLIIGLVILMRNTKPVKVVKGAVTTVATRKVKGVIK